MYEAEQIILEKLEKVDDMTKDYLEKIINETDEDKKLNLIDECQFFMFSGTTDEEKLLGLSVSLLLNQYKNEIKLMNKNIIWLDKHGFSNNYMYTREGHKRTRAYNYWCDTFPKDKVPSLLELGVDSSKPIFLELYFICIDNIDVENLAKSMIDMLCEKIWHIDDNIIYKIHIEKTGSCTNYDHGKIGFSIKNYEYEERRIN